MSVLWCCDPSILDILKRNYIRLHKVFVRAFVPGLMASDYVQYVPCILF